MSVPSGTDAGDGAAGRKVFPAQLGWLGHNLTLTAQRPGTGGTHGYDLEGTRVFADLRAAAAAGASVPVS